MMRRSTIISMKGRTCNECNTNTTRKWRHYNNKWLCIICYGKLEYNQKAIRFGSKTITFNFRIKYGICKYCGKKSGDSFKNRKGKINKVQTSIHHWFYLVIMPWACTIELCTSCHGKEGWELGQPLKNRIPSERIEYKTEWNDIPIMNLFRNDINGIKD